MAIPFRAPGASGDRNGPSPIIHNQIPLLNIMTNGQHKGWGWYNEFLDKPGSTTTYPGTVFSQYTSATLVDGSESGGVLAITPSGTEDQGGQIQFGEGFYIDTPFKLAFEARVKITDVDQADFFCGLALTDTTVIAAVTDEIGFRLADGSANILYIVSKDSAGSNTDTGDDAADATYVRLGFVVDAETSVNFYVNGVQTAEVTSGFPNDEQLAPTIAIMNGTNSANTTYVDWMYCYQWYKA